MKMMATTSIFHSNLSHPFRIHRPHLSPYFSPSYLEEEKKLFSSLGEYFFQRPLETPCEILITNTHTAFSPKDSQKNKALLILHPNSGWDNFVDQKNLPPILLGNSIRAPAVCDFMLSCLFHHYGKLHQLYNKTQWDPLRRYSRPLLEDLKVTLLGKGHIGELLLKKLTPLVKQIHCYDPFKGHNALNEIEESDVIFVCPLLHSSSKKLLNSSFFKQLKKDVLLINASRGEIIQEEELKKFLTENPLASCYLDVFEKEPQSFSSWDFWLQRNQIFLSSHIAGVYDSLEQRTLIWLTMLTQQLKQFYETYQDLSLAISALVSHNRPIHLQGPNYDAFLD